MKSSDWRPLFEPPKETLTASQRETLDALHREADERMELDRYEKVETTVNGSLDGDVVWIKKEDLRNESL